MLLMPLLNILSFLQLSAAWENQLVIGDFKMFMIRVLMYAAFLIHIFGCIWHRIACSVSFGISKRLFNFEVFNSRELAPNSFTEF
jgi:hypothetical protein